MSSEIYYNFPNISVAQKNNTLAFKYPPLSASTYQITLADGLYNLSSINQNLSDYFTSNLPGFPADLFEFTADVSTSKVSIQMNYASTEVYWALANPIRNILGFTGDDTIIAQFNGFTAEAPSQASLNQVNRVLLHCNVCSGSYLGSKGGSDVVCSMSINASVGRQITYAPQHPFEVGIFARTIDRLEFYVTNENGVRLNCNDEFWNTTALLTVYK